MFFNYRQSRYNMQVFEQVHLCCFVFCFNKHHLILRKKYIYCLLFCRKVKYMNLNGSLVDEHTVRGLSKAGKEVGCNIN